MIVRDVQMCAVRKPGVKRVLWSIFTLLLRSMLSEPDVNDRSRLARTVLSVNRDILIMIKYLICDTVMTQRSPRPSHLAYENTIFMIIYTGHSNICYAS